MKQASKSVLWFMLKNNLDEKKEREGVFVKFFLHLRKILMGIKHLLFEKSTNKYKIV